MNRFIRLASPLLCLAPILLSASAPAQNANHFYAAEFSSAPTLRVFDVDSGAAISSVPLQLSSPTDFATAPDGTLYACTSVALFRINANTGVATQVGFFGAGFTDVNGLEFTCDGGARIVAASGKFASVDLTTGQAQLIANFPVAFSGDVATASLTEFYAAFNRPSGSNLARIDTSGSAPTFTDLGPIAGGSYVYGLDFDGNGRLIASDTSVPARFYSIGNLAGPATSTPLGSTAAVTLNGAIGGIASVVPSGQQVTYCSASQSPCGATPTLTAVGVPSATATSGFVVTASNLRAGVPYALLYTTSGRASLPFHNGALCIAAPRYVVPVMLAAGTPGPCDAQVSIDLNAFAHGLLGGQPQSFLSQPGAIVQCQFIGRDQPNLLFTEALEYSICQ